MNKIMFVMYVKPKNYCPRLEKCIKSTYRCVYYIIFVYIILKKVYWDSYVKPELHFYNQSITSRVTFQVNFLKLSSGIMRIYKN